MTGWAKLLLDYACFLLIVAMFIAGFYAGVIAAERTPPTPVVIRPEVVCPAPETPPPALPPEEVAPAPEIATEGPAAVLPRPVVAEIRGAQTFLRTIGADWHDPYMTKAVIAWFRQESGYVVRVVGNNPFNIRGAGGDYAVYPTLNRGFEAAANNLLDLAPSYGYGTVLRAARNGHAIAFLGAVARSSWSATHYGVRTSAQARTTTNHLVSVYRLLPMPERKGLRHAEEP